MPTLTKRKAITANVEERRKRVAANLLAGLSYSQIAEALDVSVSTIQADARNIIKRWKAESMTLADDWIQLQIRRVDYMINGLWEKAVGGDESAIDRVIKLQDQQAKFLGHDSPIKLEIHSESTINLNKLSVDELQDLRGIVEKATAPTTNN